MANEIRVDPNKDSVMQALSSNDILSRDQFLKTLSPETHANPLFAPPDSLDNFLNSVGIVTPKIQNLRKAHVIEQHLDPLYNAYIANKLKVGGQGATVGNALDINPDFPIPSEAQQPVQGPGYGPGEPQLRPQGQRNIFSAAAGPGGVANAEARRGSGLYQEGPLPPGGPTGETVTNRNMLLPPAFQAELSADIHRRGLRGFSPNSQLKANALDRLQEIDQGAPMSSPNERSILEGVLGLVKKNDNALDQEIKGYKATQEKAKAGTADQQAQATLEATQARAASDNAKAHDLFQGFATRQRELESRITKNLAQGKAANELSGLNKERQDLQRAKLLLAVDRVRNAQDTMSPQDRDTFMQTILEAAESGLSISRDQPGFIKGMVGGSGTSHIVPLQENHLAPLMGQPPTGNPMQVPNGSIMAPEQGGIQNPEPITSIGGTQAQPTQVPKKVPPAWAQGMADGDIRKDPSGKKMMRKGNDLIEVK